MLKDIRIDAVILFYSWGLEMTKETNQLVIPSLLHQLKILLLNKLRNTLILVKKIHQQRTDTLLIIIEIILRNVD